MVYEKSSNVNQRSSLSLDIFKISPLTDCRLNGQKLRIGQSFFQCSMLLTNKITDHKMTLESKKYYQILTTKIKNYIERYPQIFCEKNHPSEIVFI